MQFMTIGQAARQAGIGIDTVRYYEREGLLPTPRRTASGYRQFCAEEVDRLRFIRRAKALGFSLEEVRELLDLNAGTGRRSAVKRIVELRLADLEARIADLHAVRDALSHLVRQCSGEGPVAGCPIIQGVLTR
ncbi:MAG: MerR family transcriptional regulator, partial [Betaproteobacteria bacterium]|nr:MerR family transcriptional regulator [Betaproteobacteria bacterium]